MTRLQRLATTTMGSAALLAALAVPAVASATNNGVGINSTVAPNAQCDTAAASGAFADVNGNFGWLGTERTPPGANGPATGLSNSSVCGNR